MSKSLIQTVNQSQQVVTDGSILSLGSVLHRFGCNCRLNGNAIELQGAGYYLVDVEVVITPTAAGNVTVTLQKDGVNVTSATATGSVTTVGNSTVLSIVTTVRIGCNCDGAPSLTAVITSGDGTVNNVSMRVIKA